MTKDTTLPSPIFVPKPIDSGYTDLGLKFPMVMLDAHITEWRPEVARKVAGVSDLLILNPVTHYLLYKNTPESFKKLPYPHGVSFEKLHSEPELRVEKLIRPSIEFQLAKNAGAILAPYFDADDDNSAKFNLNLTMLSETIRFLRNEKIQKQLYAMIYVGNGVLTRPLSINNIVDRYTDGEFNDAVTGYFIAIDQFNAKLADVDSLLGLVKLVYLLAKEGKLVFAQSIGSFGEVLGAIGATGFVGDNETISVEYLKEEGFPGRQGNRIYIPEIFDHANETEARRIGYKCKCPACGGTMATDITSKKRHLLYCRLDATSRLSKQAPEKRIKLMTDRLDVAVDFVDSYVKKYRSPFKKTHLLKWKQVLESAKVLTEAIKDAGFEKALVSDLDAKIK